MLPYSTFENSISEGNHDSLQILGKKEARLETWWESNFIR